MGSIFDWGRWRARRIAGAGLLVVAMSGCGDGDDVGVRRSGCPSVPGSDASESDWPLRAPPPEQREMMIAAGRAGSDTQAWDLTEEVDGQASLRLYGDPDAEDPFAEQDLGVVLSHDPALLGAVENEDDDQRETTTVRGREGFIARSGSDPMLGPKGAAELSWVDCEGLAVSLRSHRFGVDELVSIADQLEVTDAGVGLQPGAVDGIEQVLALEGIGWRRAGDMPAGPAVREVTYVGYPDLGGGDYEVETWTFAETTGVETLRTLFRFDHPGVHSTTVRGHDALLYEWPTSPDIEADEQFSVFWNQSPSVAVMADGSGLVGAPRQLGDDTIEVEAMTEALTLDFVDELHLASPEEADLLLTTTAQGG